MIGVFDRKLDAMGYPLDRIGKPGMVVPAVVDGLTVYCSGNVPFDGTLLTLAGKVPSAASIADAQKAAALCAANCLRNARTVIGSVDRVDRVLRVTGYVNSDPDFTGQHLVANGASQLLIDLFGENGTHARTAIGTAALPLGASVEIEMILRLKA
jgi:enamine deaminase RidA (YjgF/YER057c/UK114 family)